MYSALVTSHIIETHLRVWAQGEVSLLISSDTPYSSLRSQTRVPRPSVVQTPADVSAVPGLSSFGAGWRCGDQPRLHRRWHVWSDSQSRADSQTSNSFKHPRDCCKLSSAETLLASDLHFHQLDKYGLAEPETRWCNSPSRVSSSVTFKSEHDYISEATS